MPYWYAHTGKIWANWAKKGPIEWPFAAGLCDVSSISGPPDLYTGTTAERYCLKNVLW